MPWGQKLVMSPGWPMYNALLGQTGVTQFTNHRGNAAMRWVALEAVPQSGLKFPGPGLFVWLREPVDLSSPVVAMPNLKILVQNPHLGPERFYRILEF